MVCHWVGGGTTQTKCGIKLIAIFIPKLLLLSQVPNGPKSTCYDMERNSFIP